MTSPSPTFNSRLTQPIVVAENAAVAYLAGLAPTSRKTQAKALRAIAEIVWGPGADPATVPWHTAGYAHGQALRQMLSGHYAPATTNRLLAAWRGVLKAAWRLGTMDDQDYLRAIDVKDVRLTGELRGRALSPDERNALFEHCLADSRNLGLRDGAMLALLYACGLRRAEASALNTADLTPDGIRVRGKGGKVRLVPVPPRYAQFLLSYTQALTDHGPLLRSIDKRTGHFTKCRIGTEGIAKALRARIMAAGIAIATPHDLRRTYITDLLDHGVDPLTVAGLAGHAQIDTTRRYDRRSHATRVAAVASLGDE